MKKSVFTIGWLGIGLMGFCLWPVPVEGHSPNSAPAKGPLFQAGDCSTAAVQQLNDIDPGASMALKFSCQDDNRVYFGVCAIGEGDGGPNDRLSILFSNEQVAFNELSPGGQTAFVGSAPVSSGDNEARVIVKETPDRQAAFAYATSTVFENVTGFLSGQCGELSIVELPPPTGTQYSRLILSAGTIRGTVFEDGNGDGKMDEDEVGIPGVEVTVYSPGDWSANFTTGDDGTYAPTGLSHANYAVEITLPDGYIATGPTRYEGVTIGATNNLALGIDFAISPMQIPSSLPAAGAGLGPNNTIILILLTAMVSVWGGYLAIRLRKESNAS